MVVGVILAAGRGQRMMPLTKDTNKVMLEVKDKPLILHQLSIFSKHDINKIIVIIGYEGKKIKNYLGDGSNFGVDITYVEQKEQLGIAHALLQCEKLINEPFLVILGDIYFDVEDLTKMIELVDTGMAHAVLSTKIDTDENIRKNFEVVSCSPYYVQKVVEKPRDPVGHMKGCGIYMFSESVFEVLRDTPRTAQRNEYEITKAIQLMIEKPMVVMYIENINRDVNITTPEDLKKVNEEEENGY